jgi:hypothetical protein
MNLRRGGTVELPHTFVRLAERKEIAAVWTVHDVQRVRPDLTEHQAWAVLRQIDGDIFNRGITWETLRLTAEKLFPTTSAALGDCRGRASPLGPITALPASTISVDRAYYVA